jgi:hypothetical protein
MDVRAGSNGVQESMDDETLTMILAMAIRLEIRGVDETKSHLPNNAEDESKPMRDVA